VVKINDNDISSTFVCVGRFFLICRLCLEISPDMEIIHTHRVALIVEVRVHFYSFCTCLMLVFIGKIGIKNIFKINHLNIT